MRFVDSYREVVGKLSTRILGWGGNESQAEQKLDQKEGVSVEGMGRELGKLVKNIGESRKWKRDPLAIIDNTGRLRLEQIVLERQMKTPSIRTSMNVVGPQFSEDKDGLHFVGAEKILNICGEIVRSEDSNFEVEVGDNGAVTTVSLTGEIIPGRDSSINKVAVVDIHSNPN